MAKHTAWKTTRKATRHAANAAEKAITSLGRWATTDHTGAAKLEEIGGNRGQTTVL